MNSPAALIGTTPETAAAAISQWGFVITPEMLQETARNVGESTIISRTGGAPTLAVGMAQIFASALGGPGMMAFWYHFAILFEALFILTAVDAGTRVGRFMLQDLMGTFVPTLKNTQSIAGNLLASVLCVSAWGYFLYQGVSDPLGGINTLWPLFGISNQMLAAIALTLCTVVLFKMKRQRYAWVTLIPTTWLLICTITAGMEKIFHSNPKIGFLANAQKFQAALSQDQLLAPAKSMAQMHQIVFNNYLNAGLAALFMLVLLSVVFYGIRECMRALRSQQPTTQEQPNRHGVQAGESHVASPDHQWDDIVTDTDVHRHHHQKDHGGSMHRKELIVDISTQKRIVGSTQLYPHQHRLDTAQQEKDKGTYDINNTDFFVINSGQPRPPWE
jgi:carbon starvation protein